MKKYGLIGFPLSHSFSKKYFSDKFDKEKIGDAEYELYEIEDIQQFPSLLASIGNDLKGLNVTIPHKQAVMPFLDAVDPAAKAIGAVNVIKRDAEGKLVGYNSDYFGFKTSLLSFLGEVGEIKALVLGTGGASKAVLKALEDLGIEYLVVSRTKTDNTISYNEVDNFIKSHKLIINSTPLGMHPKIDQCPDIPYDELDQDCFLYDLVYNPEETLFMKKGRTKGAKAIHGLEMLIGQAEKAWEIWNS